MRLFIRSFLTFGTVMFVCTTALFAETSGDNSDPKKTESGDSSGRYGLSVYRSFLTMEPYEYSGLKRYENPLVPIGPIRGNSETVFPFSFWYQDPTSRLRYEFSALRFVLYRGEYNEVQRWLYPSGTVYVYPVVSLSSVSRSVETAQILRPVQLGRIIISFGGGLRHLLRETSVRSSNGSGFNRIATLSAQGTLRIEVPLWSRLGLELESALYTGQGYDQRAGYTYLSTDLQTAQAPLGRERHRILMGGYEGGAKLRFKIDEHLSFTLGTQTGFERAYGANYYSGTIYITGGTPQVYLTDYRSVKSHSAERLNGYSLGITLQI